jgi:hypothetical protein
MPRKSKTPPRGKNGRFLKRRSGSKASKRGGRKKAGLFGGFLPL